MRDILHCDLNNFYASVECRDDPSLRGKPVAVCGSIEARAGIVLAKNYEARAYDVRTGEAIWEAKRKCPSLVIVPPHMHKYAEISKQVRAIYQRYTDMVEPFGLDECWLDVTGSHFLFGSSEEIANRIREDVKRETGLTISVGVSFTKVLAKLGSDMKKPDAVTVLSPENYRQKIYPLAVNEIIGVGPATHEKLKKIGVFTLGDLATVNQEVLARRIGKAGIDLWRAVNGHDDAIVHEQSYKREVKSVGNSTTLPRDLFTNDEVWRVMLALAEQVTRKLREEGLCAGGVCVSVKTKDLAYREFQARLDFPMRSGLSFARAGFDLFRRKFDWCLPVRAVGIRAINLLPECDGRQNSFFCDNERVIKEEKLSEVADVLARRYSANTVYLARIHSGLELTEDKVNIFQSVHRYGAAG